MRTHIPLKLAKFGDGPLISRAQAKRVLASFEQFSEVCLDFEGVDSIGPAFADEIFRVYRSSHPEVTILHVKANDRVKAMIRRANATGAAPD